jgi:predicted GH43/DUF377 family glycosyl hydrolase
VNRRDWCKLSLQGAAVLAAGNAEQIFAFDNASTKNSVRRLIDGNYELNATFSGPRATVTFSERDDWPIHAALEISDGAVILVRQEKDSRTVLKEEKIPVGTQWKVRLLKKGNFFRYWVNDMPGWICDPLGVWDTSHPTRHSEPARGYLGVEVPQGSISSCTVTLLPWLPSPPNPVIRAMPEGSFKEDHVLVGGVIEHKGTFYQYFSGSRHGCQEGGGAREIGVAYSKDLKEWTVEPEPIVRIGAKGSWEPTGLYTSGAIVTHDGRIAVMYAAQNFPLWGGFGVAFANDPLGPFTKYEGNPVYKHYTHAHEFDLIRTDEPGKRYMIFYSGFTDKPARGPVGDRGYILYSDDLIHWQPHEKNPVFSPETLDNWDAVHVRPRSLSKIGDTWYLWYEGTNHWEPPTKEMDPVRPGWWDTVGLARSKDLVNWEYYPRNPALPAAGISKEQFDTDWVGWPRMFIKNGVGYVYYTGGKHIGLRTISLKELTNWNSEGGKTIDMLKGNL